MTPELAGLVSMLEYTGSYFPWGCEPVESLGYGILTDMSSSCRLKGGHQPCL